MAKRSRTFKAILDEAARGGRRSSLFWWLVAHHDELVEQAAGKQILWEPLCARFAAHGLTDVHGRPATAGTARKAWFRARRAAAEATTRKQTDGAAETSVKAPPSRTLPNSQGQVGLLSESAPPHGGDDASYGPEEVRPPPPDLCRRPWAETARNIMDGPLAPAEALSAIPKHAVNLLVRYGRGRTGGSTTLDVIVQRARHQGRRVKPLDGDLRSRTLSLLYPSVDENGRPILDGATAPPTDELPDIKAWLSAEFDLMVEEGVSRVLDLSGGDRVIQEYVRDLDLVPFCRDFGVDLAIALFLGPEMEDFRHVMQLVRAGDLRCERTMLVLNEGVIRHGQTTAGAFDPIIGHPDFAAIVKDGVRPVFMRRLTCLSVLRERGIGPYDVLERKPDRSGVKASPTLYHMTKTWLETFEREHEAAGTRDWLP